MLDMCMLNVMRMATPGDLEQLAPTGKLRGGVVVAPAASAFFAIKDDKGEPRGVTIDLLRAFAAALKLPLVLQVYANSGQVTDAVASGACDVAFMPQDAERAKKVDFGPAYYFIESTYLVPAGSGIQNIDEATHRARCRGHGGAERRANDRDGAQGRGRCLCALA